MHCLQVVPKIMVQMQLNIVNVVFLVSVSNLQPTNLFVLLNLLFLFKARQKRLFLVGLLRLL